MPTRLTCLVPPMLCPYGVDTHTHTHACACLLSVCSAPAASKPLDRVKWGAYVGAFFNKEFTANALYTDVRRSYVSLRRSALAQRGEPPLVCWVYKDWNGESPVDCCPTLLPVGNLPVQRHVAVTLLLHTCQWC